MSRRAFRAILLTGVLLCLGGIATAAALLTTSSSTRPSLHLAASQGSPATRDIPGRGEEATGGVTREAQEAFQARAYPAKDIPLSWTNKVQASWKGIVLKTERAEVRQKGAKTGRSTASTSSATLAKAAKSLALSATPGVWQSLGPDDSAVFPQTVTYSGARYVTSGRITALVAPPTSCSAGSCLLLVGAAGGGVWRTTNALANPPSWTYVSGGFDTNAIGTLYADPNNPAVIYAGTGEPNASGDSESGTGIYKSTNGGATWGKMTGTESGAGAGCGAATLGTCTVGANPFLGRSVSQIAIENGNPNHILVATARGVKGVAAASGGGVSLNNAFPPIGLWESTNGGASWDYAWNGGGTFNAARGVTDVEFDPSPGRTTDVYASAFNQGIWARRPSQAEANFVNIFPANNQQNLTADTTDRTAIAVTTKGGFTRIYAYEGSAFANSGDYNPADQPFLARLWRIDNANQPAATLAATKSTAQVPPAVGAANYPAFFTGWRVLSSPDPGNPYFATWNNCTGQCWYDNWIISPSGRPDDVYIGGSFSYAEFPNFTRGDAFGNEFSNARAIVFSNTGGDPDASNNLRTFTDLSFDRDTGQKDTCVNPYWSGNLGPGFTASPAACLRAPNLMHPDQHALAIDPSDPSIWFAGSDGGLVRPATSAELAAAGAESTSVLSNYSANCNVRLFLTTIQQFTGCTRLNSAVPTRLISMNRGLRTLQYQIFSYNPQNPGDITGGTQDNGTFERRVTPVALGGSGGDGSSQTDIWTEIIDGDGGWSGFDPSNTQRRFNWFSAPFGAVNYDNANEQETHWFIDTAPLLASGESGGLLFYPPQVADPAVGGTFYLGSRHVWRTQDWNNQSVISNPMNDCDSRSGAITASCGDFVPMGGPAGTNNAGGLTGTFYGGSRTGGSVTADEPVKTDANTMWAATSTGRLFVTQNRNCGTPSNAACVLWTRLDTLSPAAPNRFISGIYVNPANPLQAFVSYLGYNSATPATPGHVFRVDFNPGGGTATWTDLNVEAGLGAFPNTGGGDLPVTDIVRDDRNGNLYASTDFGVLKNAGGAAGAWTVFGSGLPQVEVAGLTIVMPNALGGQLACTGSGQNPCVPALYAATHGLSGWGTLLG
jgi:hypothetical protein